MSEKGNGDKAKVDSETKESVAKIVEEGRQIRDQVRTILLDSVEQKKLPLGELENLVKEILEGIAEGSKKAEPKKRGEYFGDALEGLESALQATLNAASLALEEAKGKGEKFAGEDLKQSISDLEAMEEMLNQTVSRIVTRTEEEIGEQVQSIALHGKRMAENLRPAIGAALSAARSHPLATGAEVTGIVADVVAGALQAAAEKLKKKE